MAGLTACYSDGRQPAGRPIARDMNVGIPSKSVCRDEDTLHVVCDDRPRTRGGGGLVPADLFADH